MAYFSNGSEGSYFDNQCDECIHEDPEAGCPIALVQMYFNYDQCSEGKLREAMTMLVGEDGKCKMKPLIEKFYVRKDWK